METINDKQNKEVIREFIYYFLFQVKHDYLEKLKKFKKILFSRNIALKEKDVEQIAVWTKLLIEISNDINTSRKEIVTEVLEDLEENILSKVEDNKWSEILSSLKILYDHLIFGSLLGDPSGFLKVPSAKW